ncbi:translocation protein TolB [Symmachiella dynata]|uniref:Translocation protein TolB n=1 Tax=Symmachiella dynata TaxID=2527995 RepID=A0A517ZR75_9PLAN|nr:DUF5050 domain-containing protein [Symmachiella dynata]QDU45002.1 translocation protein TolB [Symmachiella dynata]
MRIKHLVHTAIPLVLCILTAASLTAAEPAVERLTQDGLFKQRPVWSPDGNWLCFARHKGSTIFLYLLSADGKTEKRLTDRTDPEYDAHFSPDGKRLVFSFDKVSPNQGDLEVYSIGIDGKDLQPVAVNDKLSHEEYPSWSADGKWIAFTSTRDGNQELYIVRPDGKEMQRLTDHAAIDEHPTWSPDGKKIAFATNRWGDFELATCDLATQTITRLTESRGLDNYPAWSADGKTIAFTSNRTGDFEIFTMNADGTNPHNITQQRGIDNFPSWGPDGRLTWVSNRGGGFDVYRTVGVVE